jgi:hypothetical protein
MEEGANTKAPPRPSVMTLSGVREPQAHTSHFNRQALFWEIRRSPTAPGFYNLVAYRKEQFEPVIMTWDGDDYSVDWKGAPTDGIAGRSNTEGDWDVRWRSLCVASSSLCSDFPGG